MEKYGTYDVLQNDETKVVIRVPRTVGKSTDMEKTAALTGWTVLTKDPEDVKNETSGDNKKSS